MIAPGKTKTRPRGAPRRPAVIKDAPAIDSTKVYPWSSFKSITGLGDDALQAAQKAGLIVRQVHGRKFVAGKDFMTYLDAVSRVTADAPRAAPTATVGNG